MVAMLVLCSSVCCAAALPFLLHSKPSSPFTLNSFLVAGVYLVLWTPVSLAHFLSYEHFHISQPVWVAEVNSRQLADLIGAASALVTILIRLSYKPVRDTVIMRSRHLLPLESNWSSNLQVGHLQSEAGSSV